MTVEVKTRLGQLPTFWDRDVIFFANMYLFFTIIMVNWKDSNNM